MRQRAAIALALALKPSLAARRRAGDRARRHRPAPGARRAARSLQQRARALDGPGDARHQRRRLSLRRGRRDVCRPGGRERPGPRGAERGRAIPTRWACATPSPTSMSDALELVPIDGSPPDLREPAARLPLRAALPVRAAACAAASTPPRTARRPPRRPAGATARPTPFARARTGSRDMAALVELRDVVKHFPVPRSLGEIVARRAPGGARARRRRASTIGAGDARRPSWASRAAARPRSAA